MLWAVPAHLRPRLVYILGHYGHAPTQAGRQPAATKPPLYCVQYWVKFGVSEGERVEKSDDDCTESIDYEYQWYSARSSPSCLLGEGGVWSALEEILL